MTAGVVGVGAQVPRVAHHAKGSWSAGDDACFLASSYGLTADPWQALVLEAWLAHDRRGKLKHGRGGVSVARQNGKNGIIEILELYKMVAEGRKILHTAHEVKTARKAFLRLASFFENDRKFPELAALVKEVRRTNGQEAITLTNGGSCEFVARSRGSGRGYTVDDLVMDEAQDLTDEQLEALLPTIASAPSGDPQQIYAGTPPGPRSPGTVFVRVRADGVKGKDRRLAWFEWSIPDEANLTEAVQNWRELAHETNPSLGVRLSIGTVSDELKTMSVEGFCRERLGKWDSGRGVTAINPRLWRRLFLEPVDVPSSGRKVFGVRFSADGSEIGLGVAVRPKDGPIHVEGIRVASMSEGTQWLIDFLLERKDSTALTVIDGKYGVGYLVNALHDRGYPKTAISSPKLDEVIAAHSMMEQGIQAGSISTIKQDLVLKQVEGALKRNIGRDGGFGWAAPEGGSVSVLDAMTLALWGAKTTKRDPARKQVII